MGLIDVIINTSKEVLKPDPFYNQNWFTSLISSILAATVAGVIIVYDHKHQDDARVEGVKQRELEEKTKKQKELLDLKNYFFEMCSALISAVDEQIKVYENVIEQIKLNNYKPIVKKQIPSLNLNKVYYLTPGQMFEIFVTDQAGDSKENSKMLVEIFKSFDGIQGIKDLDAASSKIADKKTEASMNAFFKSFKDIDVLRRLAITKIITKSDASPNENTYIQEISDLTAKFAEDAKFNGVGQPDAEEINRIPLMLKYRDDLMEIFNKRMFFFMDYRLEFINLLNSSTIAINEYGVVRNYMEYVSNNYITALKKHKKTLENGLEKLQN